MSSSCRTTFGVADGAEVSGGVGVRVVSVRVGGAVSGTDDGDIVGTDESFSVGTELGIVVGIGVTIGDSLSSSDSDGTSKNVSSALSSSSRVVSGVGDGAKTVSS